jgi:hypothetical protein
LYGGQSRLVSSGKGQGKLKFSGNGNECKPLVVGGHGDDGFFVKQQAGDI